MQKIVRRLKEMYDEIPAFQCRKGCFDCCGPVPFAKEEWLRVRDKRPTTGFTCAYASDDGCAIYQNRPLMCRLFGAVDRDILLCPHGCRPHRLMSATRAAELRDEYRAIVEKGEVK
jgi:Fe-S-cluster containining protein